MSKIRDIVTTKNLEENIKFVVRYPGHVDLDINRDFLDADGFIVITAEAANELCTQLQDCVKIAYERAEREKTFEYLKIFKEETNDPNREPDQSQELDAS